MNSILGGHDMHDINNMYAVIANEAPPPPPQVLIPNTGIDNSVNFTAPTLTSEMVCQAIFATIIP